jgi:hypothetical protein
MHRYRVHALLCTLLLLFCELISRPFASMGVADDWSYIFTARILAQTGHIVYNGWATAMIGWQLYAGAAFLKLFGGSFTAARMSTLVVSLITTFLIQRIFVRAGINERNATIGTLAVVLTPIYMQLSVSFMTDIQGLFATVICLYTCIRAVQTPSLRAATAWILFAVASNVVFGSARQIAWLGTIVMVPSTLWMLRQHHRLLIVGSLATLIGYLGIFGSMHWFAQQPYSLTEPLALHIAGLHGAIYTFRQMLKAVLETPFLVLPLLLVFLPWVRQCSRRLVVVLTFIALAYAAVVIHLVRHNSPSAMLEPLLGDWFTAQGFYQPGEIHGTFPTMLGPGARLIVTIVATFATLCLIAFLLRLRDKTARRELAESASISSQSEIQPRPTLSWQQIGYLLTPYTIAYFSLLLPRATGNLRDRYLLEPSLVAALFLIRIYQDYLRRQLPNWTIALVALTALFSIAGTHDLFSLYRARVVIADELTQAGISANTVDGAFEYNDWTELQTAGHINDVRLKNPPNSFVPVDPQRGLSCDGTHQLDSTPAHLIPEYGLAHTPDACGGIAPIQPVTYSQWLLFHPEKLYVVKYLLKAAAND